MKAILKFNLDDADDRMAHLRCIKSTDMAGAIHQITHNLKKIIQWELENVDNPDDCDVIDKVFEKIGEVLDDHGIVINDLIQ